MTPTLPPGGHLHQPPRSRLCGPTCVAMAARTTVARALAACGNRASGTHGIHLIEGLRRLGVPCSPTSVRLPPGTDVSTLHGIVRFRNAKARPRWGGHWVLFWHGVPFDPEYGTEPGSLCGMPAGAHVTSYVRILSTGA